MIIDYPFFEKELSYIKDENIKRFTTFAVDHIKPIFFVEAASSTGKYHPDYALGFAGLYRHTQAAVKIANDLLQLDMYKEKFSESVRDYIIAALILHDSCKRGIDWSDKYTKHEHPLLVEDFLKNAFECTVTNFDTCKLTFDDTRTCVKEYVQAVSNLVKSHMGQWTTNKYSKVELPKPELEPQKFVHLCDYLASRKYLEVKLNVEE